MITVGKACARIGVAKLHGFFIESCGLRGVLFRAGAVLKASAQPVFCLGVPLIGGKAVIAERLRGVLFHAQALFEKIRIGVLRRAVPFFGRLPVILRGSGEILGNAEAALIAVAEVVHGLYAALFGGLLIVPHRLNGILWGALAGFVAIAQVAQRAGVALRGGKRIVIERGRRVRFHADAVEIAIPQIAQGECVATVRRAAEIRHGKRKIFFDAVFADVIVVALPPGLRRGEVRVGVRRLFYCFRLRRGLRRGFRRRLRRRLLRRGFGLRLGQAAGGFRKYVQNILVIVQNAVRVGSGADAHLFVVAGEEFEDEITHRFYADGFLCFRQSGGNELFVDFFAEFRDIADGGDLHRHETHFAVVHAYGLLAHGGAHFIVAGFAGQRMLADVKHHQHAAQILYGLDRVRLPRGLGFIQIFFIQPYVVAPALEFEYVGPNRFAVAAAVADEYIGVFRIAGTDLFQHFFKLHFYVLSQSAAPGLWRVWIKVLWGGKGFKFQFVAARQTEIMIYCFAI